MSGIAKAHAVLRDANHDAADHVDEGNEKACDRVAADELRGAVHGAEEGAFVLQVRAAFARLLLVDEAGGEICVDCHLLAGHGIESEPRRNFRDAARTLGDDDEIHDDKDRKDDDADDEVALHHEIAEGLDDLAGAASAFVSLAEDKACGSEIQREAQHCRNEEDSRKGTEFERLLDEKRRHQHEHGEGDRNGE